MAFLPKILAMMYLLCLLIPVALAAKPTSFCKCTCNSNSTIIALTGGDSTDPKFPKTGGTCNDCNRQFCLDYNLPICKGVQEDQIFTTCFQRDSTKDQLVVYTFIIMTVGLLVYALVRPYLDKKTEANQGNTRGPYAAVPSSGR